MVSGKVHTWSIQQLYLDNFWLFLKGKCNWMTILTILTSGMKQWLGLCPAKLLFGMPMSLLQPFRHQVQQYQISCTSSNNIWFHQTFLPDSQEQHVPSKVCFDPNIVGSSLAQGGEQPTVLVAETQTSESKASQSTEQGEQDSKQSHFIVNDNDKAKYLSMIHQIEPLQQVREQQQPNKRSHNRSNLQRGQNQKQNQFFSLHCNGQNK